MKKNIGLQLIAYSLLLAGLSFLCYHLAPSLAQTTFMVGLGGGLLCLVWGIRAIRGHRGKALPILTLAPICFLLLAQTVLAWGGASRETPGWRTATVMMTVLFVLSFVMLIRILYTAMVVYGPTAGSSKDAPTGALAAGKAGNSPNAAKRA